jgi:hypothetical protein
MNVDLIRNHIIFFVEHSRSEKTARGDTVDANRASAKRAMEVTLEFDLDDIAAAQSIYSRARPHAPLLWQFMKITVRLRYSACIAVADDSMLPAVRAPFEFYFD